MDDNFPQARFIDTEFALDTKTVWEIGIVDADGPRLFSDIYIGWPCERGAPGSYSAQCWSKATKSLTCATPGHVTTRII